MEIVQKLAIYLMDTPGSVCKLDTVAQKSRARPWNTPVLLLRRS